MSKRQRSLLESVLELSNAPSSKMSRWSAPAESAVGNAVSVSKGKKSYKRGSYKTKSLANFVKAVVRGDAEKKEALTSINSVLNATQNSVILVSGMSQGTTNKNRVGDEVTHAYIEVALTLYNSSSAALTQGDSGFWAIVLDRQPDGALAAFTDIFDDTVGGQQGNDFRNTQKYQERFKILSRNEWSVACNQATVGAITYALASPPYHVKEYIDLSKLKGNDGKEHFNTGATGAITAIDSNCLLFVIASTSSAATSVTTVSGQCKYRFTDL